MESSRVNDLAIDIDWLLDELAATHPCWCTLVEMKCFLGVTDRKAAELLGMALRTLQRMWHEARKWLRDRVGANATT